MKYITSSLLLLMLLFGSVYGQNQLDVVDKTLVYEAFFINPQQDTLTKETIEIRFKSNLWLKTGNQKAMHIAYNTDQEGIKSFIQPFEKVRKKHVKFQEKKDSGKKGWENWTWLEKESTTGYLLDDSVFWMHPPRGNQYLYTEISGMPKVQLDRLKAGGEWKSKLIIMMGWYDFKGTVVSTYKVAGTTDYTRAEISAPLAWDIAVAHEHSALGSYSSRIVFDAKRYGFLRFDNTYHDGNRIVMNLIEVKD